MLRSVRCDDWFYSASSPTAAASPSSAGVVLAVVTHWSRRVTRRRMNFLITSFDGTVNIVLGVARALPCCANTAKRDDSALFTLDQVARVPRAAISFGLSRGEM